MNTNDFDYELPDELIAQSPTEKRQDSRMMVIDKNTGEIEHKHFYDFIDYLSEGDCLVMNDTRVIPARLFGHRIDKEEKIEVFLLKNIGPKIWEVLVRPGKKMKIGTECIFSDELKLKVIDIKDDGNRIVKFYFDGIFEEILDRLGNVPLPPYITKKLEDKERYQTVYSKNPGSVAAPTAGLHFTDEIIEKIKQKGVDICYLTLDVGLGTFRPVSVDDIKEHKMHSEHYHLDYKNAEILNRAINEKRRVIAVGTTSIRTVESIYEKYNCIKEDDDYTDIFIYPGFKFNVVNCLLTNFHLPKSTLIMLVSALSDREKILKAYECAVENNYRFYSFGDCMFLN